MKPTPSPPETPVEGAWKSIDRSLRRCCSECEEKIRKAPLAAVLGAAAIGHLFRFVPVGGLLRLALALAKPAILVLGVWKLREVVTTAASRRAAEPDEPLLDSPPGPPPV